MFPWAYFQHYLVIQGCSQGLLEWLWTKWPQTSEFVLLFCCLWGLLFWFHCVCLFHVLSPSSMFLLICCGLENQETRFISEVIGSAVVTETSGQQCNTLLLQVSVKLRFLVSCWLYSPRVLSFSASSKLSPTSIPMSTVQSAQGKRGMASMQLLFKNVAQKWNHFHSHPIG